MKLIQNRWKLKIVILKADPKKQLKDILSKYFQNEFKILSKKEVKDILWKFYQFESQDYPDILTGINDQNIQYVYKYINIFVENYEKEFNLKNVKYLAEVEFKRYFGEKMREIVNMMMSDL